MPINSQTMNERNFPREDDSTAELIRKHAIYSAEWKRIVSQAITRGADYWGGYDDTVANDKTDIENHLFTRAILRHDMDAYKYIMDGGGVDGMYTVQMWLASVSDAVEALKAGDTAKVLELLTPLVPDEREATEDEEEI